jgi:hypothetical protein
MSSTAIFFENCICKRETDKAILVEIDGEDRWIPKSVVHDDSEVYDENEHNEGTLALKAWFAEKEKLT